jgi:HK97 family phage prohead protease
MIETKSFHDFPWGLKSLAADGSFKGYGAVFDRVDAQADLIAPGAFRRALNEHARNGTMPAMLWQHDPREPIGVWDRIIEDATGLGVEGRLVLETRRGAEAYALMKAGAITGLSIGYVTVTSARDDRRGIRKLLDVNLIEVSPVTFPAQAAARISQIKDRALTHEDPARAAFRRAMRALRS